MKWYFKSSLLLRIFAGLVLGIIIGIIFGEKVVVISPLGDIFIRLLKMIVMPVLIFSLISGATNISPARLGRVGVKILSFFIFTSAIAVIVGLVIGNIFKPGLNLSLVGAGIVNQELVKPNYVDMLLNMIPTNIFNSFATDQILSSIFFSIIFGIGITFLKDNNNLSIKNGAEMLNNVINAVTEVIYKIVYWIMQYAPIGVLALIAVVFGKQGVRAFYSLGMLTLTVYTALILFVIIVYGGLLFLFKINFYKFLKGTKDAIITAFVTRSGNVTLPVSMKCAEENLGIHRNICSFTLPLGANINKNGTAIYQSICMLFIGFAVGAPLSIGQQVAVLITTVIASISTAALPSAGPIMLIMILNAASIRLEQDSVAAIAYSMILGIDIILDMGRTCVNLIGHMVGTAIVAKTENEIDTDNVIQISEKQVTVV